MESSTSSAPSPSSPAMSAAAPASRASPLRWLAGFGPSGLLGLAVLLFWLLAAAFGPWLLSYSTVATGTSNVFSPISAAHWLGTDYLGRDMLARVIEGARYTVGVALLATVVASGVGTEEPKPATMMSANILLGMAVRVSSPRLSVASIQRPLAAASSASVVPTPLAIASLTIAVNLVIDNLPGRAARERGTR